MSRFTIDDPSVLRMADLIARLHRDLVMLQSNPVPPEHLLAPAPIMGDWQLGFRFEPALIGSISEHPRVADGPATTSSLFVLDTERGYARTMSGFYRLGERSLRQRLL